MPTDLTTIAMSLLQLVALTLPVVGVFLQITSALYGYENSKMIGGTEAEFLLIRWSAVPLIGAALCLLMFLFVEITFSQSYAWIVGLAIVLLGIALVLNAVAIWIFGHTGIKESYQFVKQRIEMQK